MYIYYILGIYICIINNKSSFFYILLFLSFMLLFFLFLNCVKKAKLSTLFHKLSTIDCGKVLYLDQPNLCNLLYFRYLGWRKAKKFPKNFHKKLCDYVYLSFIYWGHGFICVFENDLRVEKVVLVLVGGWLPFVRSALYWLRSLTHCVR